MDAGKLWVRDVQNLFAPVNLQKMKEIVKELENFTLNPYIWSCSGHRTVSEFLNWFEGLSSGQLFEIASSYEQSVPSNLPELRNMISEVLREWNLRYFSSINPAIIEGLAQEAASRQKQLNEMDGMEVYEQATAGMRLYPNELLKRVILVPQYHLRPLVNSSIYDEIMFTHYSCDIISPDQGHPTPALLRLTRALSDETRLCILRLLSHKQMTFTEIVREIGLSKSTIHYHLIALRAAGLVIVHYYSKNTESKNIEYSLRLEALNDLPHQIGSYLKS
ncbi:Bacterial regulatory protein, arsR family [compost metagenome]